MKDRKILIIIMIAFVWLFSQVFWFDLTEEITAKFQKYYNWWYSDDYLNAPYSSVYSKDPFGDNLWTAEDMNTQTKIAWVQSVENWLAAEGCSMNKYKLWWILYYFSPDFRMDIARSLKMELGDASPWLYVYDNDKITEYCREYYKCVHWDKNKSVWENMDIITATTAMDVMTNCKENILKYYNAWANNESTLQEVKSSQLWADKYWNGTTDDSPYDIMSDINTIWMLLYEDSEQVITPVLYHLPVFARSEQWLKDAETSSSSVSASSSAWDSSATLLGNGSNWVSQNNGWWSSVGSVSLWWGWDVWTKSVTAPSSSSSSPSALPWRMKESWFEVWYDALVEWLWAYRVSNDKSLYYGSLCKEEEPEAEPEEKEVDIPWSAATKGGQWRDFSDLSPEEYQEVVDYMLWAVDKYTSLPEDKKEEIGKKAGDLSRFDWAVDEASVEAAAEEIKSCWKSCEWLRIDQKASCMLMCACWEIKSPIFNPEETPWLWPIFMIRFCTVPAQDMKFSKWWRKMVSIEEWMKEINWVVDKLSREWRLWIWTQQYNFLDSTTKKMNFSDSIAFSLSVEWVDVWENYPEQSEQYSDKVTKKINKWFQEAYWIYNSLENAAVKNAFRLIWFDWEIVEDFAWSANVNAVTNARSQSNQAPEVSADLLLKSTSSRYNSLTNYLRTWFDQQASLWYETMIHIWEWTDYAKKLYSKKW